MGKHDHQDGLAFHLRALRDGTLKRREIMGWAVGAGIGTFVGCGDDDDSSADGGAASGGKGGKGGSGGAGGKSGAGGAAGKAGSSGAGGKGGSGGSVANGSCTKVPEETAGPYPADGSNSASGMGGMGMGTPSGALIDAFTMSGIVRKDIRSSFGSSTKTAEGVPLSIKLQIIASNDDCKPLAGAAVYIWHCDRGGNYSLYSSSIMSENYLRGVQETDDEGKVEFQSIFPACYSGRWPHIHFEVYPSLDEATSQANTLGISQIAMPETTCKVVFKESGYEASVNNFSMTSLATDMVFSDGYDLELPTIAGSVSAGYTVSLTAAVTKK
jgi:protocatechuate 3,4-dioxygenase beta subunit